MHIAKSIIHTYFGSAIDAIAPMSRVTPVSSGDGDGSILRSTTLRTLDHSMVCLGAFLPSTGSKNLYAAPTLSLELDFDVLSQFFFPKNSISLLMML